MLPTYSAILENDRLRWINGEPDISPRPLSVLVTIMSENLVSSAEEREAKIAQILNALAARGGLTEIADPVEWQRELREERTLPGRD